VKQALILGLIGLVAGTLYATDSGLQDKIISATKQLGGKSNYSWCTTTVEIKDAGSTKLEVPAEAKQKMS
jgi:hypothetical protein